MELSELSQTDGELLLLCMRAHSVTSLVIDSVVYPHVSYSKSPDLFMLAAMVNAGIHNIWM
jgi:hypothetical protein